MDGRQVLQLIRKDESLKDIKIVVVTGAKDPADLKEIEALKPDALFRKPFSPDAFKDQITTFLSRP